MVSVYRKMANIYGGNNFWKKVGLKLETEKQGVINDESAESMTQNEVTDVEK